MPTSPFPAAPRTSGELLASGPRYLLASRTGVAHQRRPENQGLRPNKTAANQDNRPQTGLGRSWLDVAGERGDPSGPGPRRIPCWRRRTRVASSGLTADGGSWGTAGDSLWVIPRAGGPRLWLKRRSLSLPLPFIVLHQCCAGIIDAERKKGH